MKDLERKRQLLQELIGGTKLWSIDDFVQYIDERIHDLNQHIPSEIGLAIRLAFELEKEQEKNKVLMERMEDLCKEMEHGTSSHRR